MFFVSNYGKIFWKIIQHEIYEEEFFSQKQQVLEKRILTKVDFRPAAAGFKNAVEDLKNEKLGFGFNMLIEHGIRVAI